MEYKTICFIGAGKMASAIINGLLTSRTYDCEHIIAVEVNDTAAEAARQKFGIKVYSKAEDAIVNADIILIATKPFVVPDLLLNIKNLIKEQQLIIDNLKRFYERYPNTSMQLTVNIHGENHTINILGFLDRIEFKNHSVSS